MVKRITIITLCIILVLGISVWATDAAEDSAVESGQTIAETPPQGERPQWGGRGGMPPGMSGENGERPARPEGGMPGDQMPPDFPEGMTPPEMPGNGNVPPQTDAQKQQVDGSNGNAGAIDGENGNTDNMRPNRENWGVFPGEVPPSMAEQMETTAEKTDNGFLTFVKTYSTPIISFVLLAFAFVFVIFYKRKNY